MTDISLQAAPHAEASDVKVWDPFVRFFHWALVALFVVAFATAEDYETAHLAAGYAILVLVLARIVWGFVGPAHARFRGFVFAPRQTLRFMADTARLKARRYLGHNPAGGLMVVALMAMMLAITATGIMQTLDGFADAKWVEEVHEGAVFATLGLIGLHLLGVLVASIEHRENLVRSMITGRKRPLDQA